MRYIMDHIPTDERIKVPFYARNRIYSPEEFFTIPAKDYQYEDYQDLLENGLRSDMKDGAANEFLHSWLYFALLAQVLGKDINSDDFFKKDDHTLTTNQLNVFLADWVKRGKVSAETQESRTNISQYIRASIALENARRFVSKHCSYDHLDRDDWRQVHNEAELSQHRSTLDNRLDSRLTLSIAILGETLQRERQPLVSGLSGELGRFHNKPDIEEKSWGYSKFCREKMRNDGWCPFEIRRIESTIREISVIYYICTMKPWQSRSKEAHKGCTIWTCAAELHFESALHLNDCHGEGCRTTGIDEREIVSWIEQGKIPLVSWTPSRGMQSEAYDLKNGSISFGALTHSWEDGIVDSGKDVRNKNNRRMHLCQIERAQDTFNQLLTEAQKSNGIKSMPFWIDVLCLPRHGKMKSQAINQIQDIYKKAHAVLVWERTLLKTRRLDSKIEMNMRIRLSSWAQRLWTLQEAVLATNLYIEFEDGTVSTCELEFARNEARDELDNKYHHIWKAGHPFSSPVWKIRKNKDYRVERAWQEVQFRQLSKTEQADETIVLANVLGIDVTELENISEGSDEVIAAKRMVRFLDLLDKTPGLGIPSGIIFLPPPKLEIEGVKETKGFGWAPRTWLSRQAHSYPLFRPLSRAGSILSHGLGVKFPGVILHCPEDPDLCPETERFYVSVHQSMHKWYKVVADPGGKGQSWKDFWKHHVVKDKELSIIMSMYNPRERWEIGLLVQTKGLLTRGEVRWVKVLCRVWFRLETNPNINRDNVDHFRTGERSVMFGVRLEKQKWCVDGDDD